MFPAQQAGRYGDVAGAGRTVPGCHLRPTGGITAKSHRSFLALPNVGCVGGSWLTPKAALATGDWAAITVLARQASSLDPR
ncbi:MAG: hypothetical protein R3F36_12625 [Candidatus Competibacteraceae bacterium]